MMTIDNLKKFGANTTEGLGRCLNNEMLYLRLVGKFLEDTNIYGLKDAVLNNDLDQAFETAHALKGVLSNLALSPLTEIMVELTENLRNRKAMDYMPLIENYLTKLEELKSYNN